MSREKYSFMFEMASELPEAQIGRLTCTNQDGARVYANSFLIEIFERTTGDTPSLEVTLTSIKDEPYTVTPKINLAFY